MKQHTIVKQVVSDKSLCYDDFKLILIIDNEKISALQADGKLCGECLKVIDFLNKHLKNKTYKDTRNITLQFLNEQLSLQGHAGELIIYPLQEAFSALSNGGRDPYEAVFDELNFYEEGKTRDLNNYEM